MVAAQGVSDACGVEVLMAVVAALNLVGMALSFHAIDDSLWERQKAEMAAARGAVGRE